MPQRQPCPRAIARLLEDFGGYRALAVFLNVNVDELRAWAEGRARPPAVLYARIMNVAAGPATRSN
jgi:hypothetical protein